MEIRIGCSAVHIAFVTEKISRSPQQLDSRGLLFCLSVFYQGCQSLFVFYDIISIIHDIYVVEAIIRQTNFSEKLERRIHFIFRTLNHVITLIPGKEKSWPPKRITAVRVE